MNSLIFTRAGILFEQLDEESKQEEIMNIKNGFNYAKKVISTGADMVVVLDEMLGFWICILISRRSCRICLLQGLMM